MSDDEPSAKKTKKEEAFRRFCEAVEKLKKDTPGDLLYLGGTPSGSRDMNPMSEVAKNLLAKAISLPKLTSAGYNDIRTFYQRYLHNLKQELPVEEAFAFDSIWGVPKGS